MITSEAGSTNDLMARLIAQAISSTLGQQIVVENRPGGIIAGEIAAKAPPDGYTVLLFGNTLWLVPFLTEHVPFDPTRDFAPVTLAAISPNVVVVNLSSPVNSIKELVVWATTKPGELNYGSSGSGSTNHLAAELFKSMTATKIVRVPYKGSGAALNALLGGEVQLMFPSAGAAAPFIKSGKLKALAVASAQPSALAPGLPTVAAAGLPGYESGLMTGVFVPAKTSKLIIGRLQQEIAHALNKTEMKERLLGAGAEAMASTPEAFAARIKSDRMVTGKMIKDLGIRGE